MEKCSSFSTSLSTPAVSWVFNLSHSAWCVVKSQGYFDLHSLMTNDVEHFLCCFIAIRCSSGQNSLFSSVPHFLIGLFGILGSNFLSSFYISYISPLSDVGLGKTFSQFVVCQFVLLTMSFALQKRCMCQFLILEHKLLVLCSGTFTMCRCPQGSSPVSFLLVWVCLVLSGGP